MKKRWLLIIAVLAFLLPQLCFADSGRKSERHYQKIWCDLHSGAMEVRLDDGSRADCVTADYAVEVDFERKWSEAIGQSLWYAEQTGLKPAIVLVMDNLGDTKYYDKLRKILGYVEIPIALWKMSATTDRSYRISYQTKKKKVDRLE